MGVGIGVNRYRSDRSNFVSALVEIGLLESIAAETLRELHWSIAVLTVGVRPSAAQGHQRRRAEKAVEPIIVKAHAQAMADQARGHRIEHFL